MSAIDRKEGPQHGLQSARKIHAQPLPFNSQEQENIPVPATSVTCDNAFLLGCGMPSGCMTPVSNDGQGPSEQTADCHSVLCDHRVKATCQQQFLMIWTKWAHECALPIKHHKKCPLHPMQPSKGIDRHMSMSTYIQGYCYHTSARHTCWRNKFQFWRIVCLCFLLMQMDHTITVPS